MTKVQYVHIGKCGHGTHYFVQLDYTNKMLLRFKTKAAIYCFISTIF